MTKYLNCSECISDQPVEKNALCYSFIISTHFNWHGNIKMAIFSYLVLCYGKTVKKWKTWFSLLVGTVGLIVFFGTSTKYGHFTPKQVEMVIVLGQGRWKAKISYIGALESCSLRTAVSHCPAVETVRNCGISRN